MKSCYRSDGRERWLRTALAIAGLLLFGAGVPSAQTITINNDLVIGNIYPGIPKTITKYTAGAAAEFHVAGPGGSEVSIDFTLPTYMNQSGWNMQMIFTKTDCSLDTRPFPNQSSPLRDDLNPWQTIIQRLGAQGLTIWLGGTVVPKIAQPAGAYTASIVLTVAYTGG